MENMITMAYQAGALVHEVGEYDAVIVFTEKQLNDFVNRVSSESEEIKNENG
jgi:hypothetical protein